MEQIVLSRAQFDQLRQTLGTLCGYIFAFKFNTETIALHKPLPVPVEEVLLQMRQAFGEAYEQCHQLHHQITDLIPGADPTLCVECFTGARPPHADDPSPDQPPAANLVQHYETIRVNISRIASDLPEDPGAAIRRIYSSVRYAMDALDVLWRQCNVAVDGTLETGGSQKPTMSIRLTPEQHALLRTQHDALFSHLVRIRVTALGAGYGSGKGDDRADRALERIKDGMAQTHAALADFWQQISAVRGSGESPATP